MVVTPAQALKPSILGALAGVAAWWVALPYAATFDRDGTKVGDVTFSLGSTHGWLSHAAFGALVVGALAGCLGWRRGVAGLVIGGLLGCATDAGSDLLSISILRAGAESAPITLMGHLALAFALAAGVWLCAGAGWAGLRTAFKVAALAGFVAHMAMVAVDVFGSFYIEGNGFDEDSRARVWDAWNPNQAALFGVAGFLLGILPSLMRRPRERPYAVG